MLCDRCRPYYTILVRSEPAERRAGYELLIKGLERFSEELEKTSDTGMLTNKTVRPLLPAATCLTQTHNANS